jgi:hypothetical protein
MVMHRSRSNIVGFTLVAGLAAGAHAQLIRAGTSADAAGLNNILNAYRADLGTLNPNQQHTFLTGRREINWDGVPDNASSPNAFPGDFFNGAAAGRARGTVYSTPGSALLVSADNDNPTGTPKDFANIDPSYAATFEPFTQQRLFAAQGSNVIDVNFFIAGTTIPATTRGFGAVFSDVDLEQVTNIEYFDAQGHSILDAYVPNLAGSATFSFLGASFDDAIVARVRLTLGNAALGVEVTDGLRGETPTDLVVTDDFIYGEPVPAPGSAALLALAGGAAARRRRRD